MRSIGRASGQPDTVKTGVRRKSATLGRIPMGSSEDALIRYGLAETPDDDEMADFSIERHRQDLIPHVKAALKAKGDMRFWGSPWSPPPWMKDNTAFERGQIKSDAKTLQACAH